VIALLPVQRREFRHEVTAAQARATRAQCGGGPGCYVCANFVFPHREYRVWWQWLWFRWGEHYRDEAVLP
jgi:hypothetical protein